MNTKKVNRVEIIDAKGRSYVNMKVGEIDMQLQDDDKTLKIFIKEGTTNALDDIQKSLHKAVGNIRNFMKKK